MIYQEKQKEGNDLSGKTKERVMICREVKEKAMRKYKKKMHKLSKKVESFLRKF